MASRKLSSEQLGDRAGECLLQLRRELGCGRGSQLLLQRARERRSLAQRRVEGFLVQAELRVQGRELGQQPRLVLAGERRDGVRAQGMLLAPPGRFVRRLFRGRRGLGERPGQAGLKTPSWAVGNLRERGLCAKAVK